MSAEKIEALIHTEAINSEDPATVRGILTGIALDHALGLLTKEQVESVYSRTLNASVSIHESKREVA